MPDNGALAQKPQAYLGDSESTASEGGQEEDEDEEVAADAGSATSEKSRVSNTQVPAGDENKDEPEVADGSQSVSSKAGDDMSASAALNPGASEPEGITQPLPDSEAASADEIAAGETEKAKGSRKGSRRRSSKGIDASDASSKSDDTDKKVERRVEKEVSAMRKTILADSRVSQMLPLFLAVEALVHTLCVCHRTLSTHKLRVSSSKRRRRPTVLTVKRTRLRKHSAMQSKLRRKCRSKPSGLLMRRLRIGRRKLVIW